MRRARVSHWRRGSSAAALAVAASTAVCSARGQPSATASAAPPPAASNTAAPATSITAPQTAPARSAPSPPAATTPASISTSTTSALTDPREWRLKRWVTLWRTRRAEYRAQRLLRLRHRLHQLFGGQPLSRAVLDELETYARRVALLHRIKQLAIEQDDADGLDRVEALLAQEHRRHSRWMQRQAAAGTSGPDGGP